MSNQQKVSLGSIGQVSVSVHDFDHAVAFYKDTLELKHLFSVPSVPGRMAFFDCSGVRLMLAIPEHPDLDHPSSIIYFAESELFPFHEEFFQTSLSKQL